MFDFLLYSTSGCHLCEKAELLLLNAQRHWQEYNLPFKWQEEEIAHSSALLQKYALKIPVLKSPTTEAELPWPFDAEQLDAWLNEQITEKS